ncbi:hypothetical protein BTVI_02474 [Pitangus sulphuratus]|nr:hypothetical protein BTVI_02474 [Pitangus sulphuratus]
MGQDNGMGFHKDPCSILHLGHKNPSAAVGWRKSVWKAAQQRRTWVLWLTAAEHEPTCAQVTKTAKGILTWISNIVASRTRVVIISLISIGEVTARILGSVSCLS